MRFTPPSVKSRSVLFYPLNYYCTSPPLYGRTHPFLAFKEVEGEFKSALKEEPLMRVIAYWLFDCCASTLFCTFGFMLYFVTLVCFKLQCIYFG